MELLFLGTGAGVPSKGRNVAAVVLRMLEERGKEWLFDCGEGTQQQILYAPVKLHRVEKVFISHLHGDHVYGLPGVLSSRSFQGATLPLTLYGPAGLRSFIEGTLSISRAHLTYPLSFVELRDGLDIADGDITVHCRALDHVVPSFGFRVVERDSPGRLRTDLLRTHGVAPGPVYGELKAGKRVTLPDGRMLHGTDYVSPPLPGRTVTILGDTQPCDGSLSLSQDADVLVHEATFTSDKSDGAHEYGHSTAVDAAKTAKRANVSTLILTHISARYQGADAQALLDEATAIHADTLLAEDMWSYVVPRKKANQ